MVTKWSFLSAGIRFSAMPASTAWVMAERVSCSFSARRLSASCFAAFSSAIFASTSVSVAVAARPSDRASFGNSICFCFEGLLLISGSGLLPSFPSSRVMPLRVRTIASSFAPMSTIDTSTSLLLVMVGRVWPGLSSFGSSLISRISRPALTMRRLPNSNCFLARILSSDASSKTSSPVTSPFSTLMSLT